MLSPIISNLQNTLVLLYQILQEFFSKEYYDEILRARYEYNLKTGIVTNFGYDIERMNKFIYWYIFERELSEVELQPLYYYIFKGEYRKEDKKYLKLLSLNIYSLFRIKKIKPKKEFIKFYNKYKILSTVLYAKDLIHDKTVKLLLYNGFYLDIPEVFDNFVYLKFFQKGDIFSARIFPLSNDLFYLLPGLTIHNPKAYNILLKKIAMLKNLEYGYIKNFLDRLDKVHLKLKEYWYLEPRKIYKEILA